MLPIQTISITASSELCNVRACLHFSPPSYCVTTSTHLAPPTQSNAPSLKSFSSPSISSPLLDRHDDEADLSHTLSRLAGLKVEADKLEKKQDTTNELG